MSTISTHVLDTALGRPAAGLPITLEILAGDGADEIWNAIGGGTTNADGRVRDLVAPDATGKAAIAPGTYRMTFDTGTYFAAMQTDGFYPIVRVEFVIRAADEHYHVPLLLSPFGYSTYRGS